MTIDHAWRGPLTDPEFGARPVGFANVIDDGDGDAQAAMVDAAVDSACRGSGVGAAEVRTACAGARAARLQLGGAN